MAKRKKMAKQDYDLDDYLGTLFAKDTVILIYVVFVDEDCADGKALKAAYKPLGARRRDLGKSTLLKATFYLGSLGGGPALVTVVNRCYGMTFGAGPLIRYAYQKRVPAIARQGAKNLVNRLRSVTFEPADWKLNAP